jgi:pimeloyl-ACP methyl ester carboxylesterase
MSAALEMTQQRGRVVEIGEGRTLRAVLAGPVSSPRPLVVLEAGSFGFSADWAAVQARLAAEGLRSLAYDRAGLGLSEPGPEPRDSRAIVADLEALLAALGEAGPLIVCGHSMAGMHVRLFALRNQARVRAVALVDATTPEAMDHPAVPSVVGHFARLSKVAAWGAQIGVQRPLAGALGDAIGLPPLAKAEKRLAFADAGHNHWAAAEVAAWVASADEARAAGAYDPDLPIAVVLTGDGRQPLARHAIQTAPADAARHGFVIHVPGANHASLLGERHAGHIVGAILTVEQAAGGLERAKA